MGNTIKTRILMINNAKYGSGMQTSVCSSSTYTGLTDTQLAKVQEFLEKADAPSDVVKSIRNFEQDELDTRELITDDTIQTVNVAKDIRSSDSEEFSIFNLNNEVVDAYYDNAEQFIIKNVGRLVVHIKINSVTYKLNENEVATFQKFGNTYRRA